MTSRLRLGLAIAAASLLWATAAFGWSFAVCGDSRDDRNGIFRQILSSVEKSDMEFLVHTGDLERPGGAKSWKAFREKARGFSKPMRIVIGNHELYGGTREEFTAFFGLPSTSYSFRHKDVRFLVLDNARGSFTHSALEWLDRELGSHPKGKDGVARLVVAMHYPPQTDNIFSHGTVKGYADQSIKLLEILSRHKVDLVLSGHMHMHHVDDWGGIKVIVTGGAGAPLVPFQRYGFYRIDVTGDGFRETFVTVKPAPSKTKK